MSDASEIIKSGAADKLADILHRLAGPMAEECGQLLADKVKVYRLKNWISVVSKTEKILSDANLPPNAVPPRMFLPILEASSIEDDDNLQDLWAGLLATASQEADSISPAFVETLKQLTPDEARHLQSIYKAVRESRHHAPFGAPDTFERLGLIRRDFNVKLRTNTWGRREPSSIEEAVDAIEPEMGYRPVLTQYAFRFLEACNGPRSAEEQGKQMSRNLQRN